MAATNNTAALLAETGHTSIEEWALASGCTIVAGEWVNKHGQTVDLHAYFRNVTSLTEAVAAAPEYQGAPDDNGMSITDVAHALAAMIELKEHARGNTGEMAQ